MTAADDHPKLKDLKPSFKEQLRAKSKQMLIDEELRRRRSVEQNWCCFGYLDLIHRVDRAVKVQMTNEGREAQAKEQEVIQRKRKAEDDKVWEGM